MVSNGSLPRSRPSRVVVEAVAPLVDGGAFPAKATVGEPVTVLADVFTDGHDRAAAALRYRFAPSPTSRRAWQEIADRGRSATTGSPATFVPDQLGRWQYQVVGWLDHLGTWLHGMELKLAAEVDVTVDLQIGVRLVDRRPDATTRRRRRRAGRPARAARRPATPAPLGHLADDDAVHVDGHVPDLQDVEPEHGGAERLERAVLADRAFASPWPSSPTARHRRRPGAGPVQRLVRVLPPLAAGARRPATARWPTPSTASTTSPRWASTSSTCRRCTRSAHTQRKGRNNTVDARHPTTPAARGRSAAPEGGHTAVHPELGTVEDVVKLAAGCRERGMELALDIAFQCTPDHPWVTEHPEWFAHRPDGTIQYAENPPKKYQDIYPLDFESDDWQGLWTGAGRRHPLLDRRRRHRRSASTTRTPRRSPSGSGRSARSVASTRRRSSSPRRSPGRG